MSEAMKQVGSVAAPIAGTAIGGPGLGMALGAATGAAMNRDNPLLGAALGGAGGYFGGKALGGLNLSGGAGQMPAALASGNVSLPFASQGASGLSGLGGLLGKIDPAKAMMQGGQMMQQQNQPQPMSTPPVPPPQAQFNRGSFQALGQGQGMYQPFNTRR